MTNPFQLKTPPSRKSPSVRASKSKAQRSIWVGALTTAGVLLLLGWLIGQTGWLPGSLRGILPAGAQDKIYADTPGMNQQQARSLYRKALNELKDNRFDDALAAFKKLESVYPGLQDLLWLHQAECYAGQGNEWAVQKKLRTLLDRHGDSPLRGAARYRIGQSQFRGSEWEQARETFNRVRQEFPQSDYAMGSLYYQGALLAKNESTQAQAIEPLKSYLSQCPDCKFSGEAANLLETLIPNPTPADHALIGLAQAAAGSTSAATLEHLNQGPRTQTWLALGKAQIQNAQKAAGVQTLTEGLTQAQKSTPPLNPTLAQEAIDRILANSPNKLAALTTLQNQSLPIGGDYVLWQASLLDSANAARYYQRILQQYPKSDYAPESGWSLLWPLLAGGQADRYLSQAQQYLSQYPYARSAPKALFWTAKLLERGNPEQAVQAYQRLSKDYPYNYYAFRAKARLNVLTRGQADTGWATSPQRRYPPTQSDLNQLNILPPAPAFGGGLTGEKRRSAAQELQAIGAPEDLRLWLHETVGEIPPAVESWAHQVAGDRAKGLRIIRDALEERVRASHRASGGQSIQPAGTPDELKLLYPIYFSEAIAPISRRQGLDPFLVQALMREESYFNEFAISSSNARGLMQLLPSTAREVAGWERLSAFQTPDLFTPAINIQLGSRYLAHLHQLFKGNSMPAVGAYNGGPNAMRRWVEGSPHFQNDPDMFIERIPYEQSRDYIKKVFGSYWNYQRLYEGSTP